MLNLAIACCPVLLVETRGPDATVFFLVLPTISDKRDLRKAGRPLRYMVICEAAMHLLSLHRLQAGAL